jgi:hypothetical protein
LLNTVDFSQDEGVKELVGKLFQPSRKNGSERAFFSRLLPENADKDRLMQKLLDSDRSKKALFKTFMEVFAGDAPVRGEKTPANIHHLPMIMEWFPKAKFIHTLRDPRAVCYSQLKKKLKAPHSVSRKLRLLQKTPKLYELAVTLSFIMRWLRVCQLHAFYSEIYAGRYHVLRFEDLLTSPRQTLQRVCDFLNIEFCQAMLNPRLVNSSFDSSGSITGFNLYAVERWRRHLSPLSQRMFLLFCRKQLLEFGYKR